MNFPFGINIVQFSIINQQLSRFLGFNLYLVKEHFCIQYGSSRTPETLWTQTPELQELLDPFAQRFWMSTIYNIYIIWNISLNSFADTSTSLWATQFPGSALTVVGARIFHDDTDSKLIGWWWTSSWRKKKKNTSHTLRLKLILFHNIGFGRVNIDSDTSIPVTSNRQAVRKCRHRFR